MVKRDGCGVARAVPREGESGLGSMLDKATSLWRAVVRGRHGGWCYLGDGVGVALTHFGRKIFLPGGDFGITPDIALHGIWEPHVEAQLRRLLKPGMRVVEVGANVGFHTLVMAEAVGPTGHIHAFEPYPRVLRLLRQTIALNRFAERVTIHASAALHAAGEVEFAVDPDQAGSAHLAIPIALPAYSERFTVPTVRLDEALAEEGAVDLLRMDVEGTEGLVMIGAEALIARSPNLVVVAEWAPNMLAARGDVGELVAWLAAIGFRFHRIERNGTLTGVAAADLPALPHAELIMTRG